MGKSKNRAYKITEYAVPTDQFYLVVANPFGLIDTEGIGHQNFHNRLGVWLEWISGMKTTGIYYNNRTGSVIVAFPGQLNDDLKSKLLGEFVMVNPNTCSEHVSQVFEYDYARYGSPSETLRCAYGVYTIKPRQKREMLPPRDYTMTFERRWAKIDMSRFKKATPDDPQASTSASPPLSTSAPPVIDMHSRSSKEISSADSRWRPYESPLDHRARVRPQPLPYDAINHRALKKEYHEPKLENDGMGMLAQVKAESEEAKGLILKAEEDHKKDGVLRPPEDPRVVDRRQMQETLSRIQGADVRTGPQDLQVKKEDEDTKDGMLHASEDFRGADRKDNVLLGPVKKEDGDGRDGVRVPEDPRVVDRNEAREALLRLQASRRDDDQSHVKVKNEPQEPAFDGGRVKNEPQVKREPRDYTIPGKKRGQPVTASDVRKKVKLERS